MKKTILLLKGKSGYMLFTQMYLKPSGKNILNMNRWEKYTKQMITKIKQVY